MIGFVFNSTQYLIVGFGSRRGAIEILLEPVRFGFVYHRSDEHELTLFFSKWRKVLWGPGEYKNEEFFDSLHQQVVKHVEFEGETYTFISGTRLSYFTKNPMKVTKTAIWMPHQKHEDSPFLVPSVGLVNKEGKPADIPKVLGLMKEMHDELLEHQKIEEQVTTPN